MMPDGERSARDSSEPVYGSICTSKILRTQLSSFDYYVMILSTEVMGLPQNRIAREEAVATRKYFGTGLWWPLENLLKL